MDVLVHTGSTRARDDATPVSLVLESSDGEKGFLLVQVDALPDAAKALEEECTVIVRHALLGSDGEPWHRLDGTLKELNGLFKGLLLSQAITDVHAIVGLFDREETLHVSHAGRGEAYLIRGGLAAQITEYSRGKPVAAFVHISSGQLEPGDTVLLSTQRLLRTFTPAQLAVLAGKADIVEEVLAALEAEHETAAVASVHLPRRAGRVAEETRSLSSRSRGSLPSRRLPSRRRGGFLLALPDRGTVLAVLQRAGTWLGGAAMSVGKTSVALGKKAGERAANAERPRVFSFAFLRGIMRTVTATVESFIADLRHPQRKRRAHLLLMAIAVGTFLIIWLLVSLSTTNQRSKSRAELAELVTQINEEIRMADTRKLAGDSEAANTILQRAEDRAKQVMDNEAGLFRVEALDLLDRIRQKREELNNVVRVSPRVVVNLSSKNADVSAQGLMGLGDGEFIIYDRQDAYRVLLNRLDDPKRVTDEDLILRGTYFARQKSQVFMTTGNTLVELSGNQLTTMKTDDPNGWMTGKDVEAYLRYLYVLAPEEKQIYKYERLSNRYGPAVQYNVNGDLTDALDMAIDGSVYVLKEDGQILKLLRGEAQPFAVRNAPEDVLQNATKIFKIVDKHLYILDPQGGRIIVATDGGPSGEALYEKQYILEGEQLGTLQDLYVDPDQSHLYVIDEKRLYVVDLAS